MNYYDAARIRKKGFANLMADKLASGQGIVSSIRGTLSDRSKAKSLAFKEKFDPMNIAKFLTGGSNLAPAIVGRLTGRSKEDIGYFTGKRQYQYTPRQSNYWQKFSNPNMGGSSRATEALEKIVSFMEKSREDDVREQETLDSYNELNEYIKADNHKEVMNVFKEAIKNKRKAMKQMAKEAKKRAALEKSKKELPPTPAPTPVPTPKPPTPAPQVPVPKPTTPAPQAPAPQVPAPKPTTQAPGPQAPAPQAPAPQAPTPKTGPTASKAPPVKQTATPAFESRVAQGVKNFKQLGLTNAGSLSGLIAVSAKESGFTNATEAGVDAWRVTIDRMEAKQKGSGYQYANETFKKNFTPQQYDEAIAKGNEYFFGPNFMSQYEGGWKYRGRGFIQITHKGWYKAIGDYLGIDLVNDPDLITRDDDVNFKATLTYIAMSLARDKSRAGVERGLQILNSFPDAKTATEYIAANVRFGFAGVNKDIVEKYYKIQETQKAKTGLTKSLERLPQIQGMVSQSSTENADLKKQLNQSGGQNASTPIVNQNNITTQQKNVNVNSAPLQELNPRIGR